MDPDASKNLWNCGGTLGEKGLQFAPTCQGGEMQVLKSTTSTSTIKQWNFREDPILKALCCVIQKASIAWQI